jgi:hypothetical protein
VNLSAPSGPSPITVRRVLLAVLTAGVCSWIFATCVFLDFQGIRIRLVRAPMPVQETSARVEMRDERARDLTAPFALIIRIRNEIAAPQRFSIRLDDRTVCDAEIPAATARRVDCAVVEWNRSPVADLTVQPGLPGPWALEYLELATHHGRSTGWLDALVLPRQALQVFSTPRLAWVVVAGLLIAALVLVPPARAEDRRLRLSHIVLSSVATLPFAAAVVAPRVSSYRIILSVSTFAVWLSIPLFPRLWTIGAWIARPLVPRLRGSFELFFGTPQRIACALAVAFLVVTVAYGARVAGAADEYGYVSEADLWLSGQLLTDQPFVADFPWPERAALWFSPLGYRPHPERATAIVPVYSPGLPMLLAMVKAAGGHGAMFFVVPLCGALLVLATYAVGRRLGSGIAPLVATWLVATSPVVLSHAMLTMSDVPVAAAWTGAFYFLLGTSTASAAGAGLLSGIAVLIRPNLAPLIATLGLLYLLRMRESGGRSLMHLAVFGAAAAPTAVVIAVINNHLYGSPLASGYGRLSELFEAGRMLPNLRNYLVWLGEAHTPAVYLGLAALLFPIRRLWPEARERRAFLVIGAFVAGLWAIYCAWIVFDTWWFGRFLLSSYPFIMLGVGASADALFRLQTTSTRNAAVICVLAVGIANLHLSLREPVFQNGPGTRRYVVVAYMTKRVTEPNSVVISYNHSGSIRYYGERMTINIGHVSSEDPVDEMVAWLEERGVRTYAALEDWELKEFSTRFTGKAVLEAFKRPPIAVFRNPGDLRVYELSTRNRRSGQPVIIEGLQIGRRAILPGRPPSLVLPRDP